MPTRITLTFSFLKSSSSRGCMLPLTALGAEACPLGNTLARWDRPHMGGTKRLLMSRSIEPGRLVGSNAADHRIDLCSSCGARHTQPRHTHLLCPASSFLTIDPDDRCHVFPSGDSLRPDQKLAHRSQIDPQEDIPCDLSSSTAAVGRTHRQSSRGVSGCAEQPF